MAFDVVARGSTMTQANAALGRRSRLVLVGVLPDPVDLGPEATYAVSRHTAAGHLISEPTFRNPSAWCP